MLYTTLVPNIKTPSTSSKAVTETITQIFLISRECCLVRVKCSQPIATVQETQGMNHMLELSSCTPLEPTWEDKHKYSSKASNRINDIRYLGHE